MIAEPVFDAGYWRMGTLDGLFVWMERRSDDTAGCEFVREDDHPRFYTRRDAERAIMALIQSGYDTEEKMEKIDGAEMSRICYEAMAW